MKKIFAGALFTLLLFPQSLLAFDMRADEAIYVDEKIENDLYTAGQTVELQAELNGDFFGAGENLVLGGVVSEDVFAAGSRVTINGPVRDDVRAVGERIEITSVIGGDVLLAGQSLNLSGASIVEGDVLFAGQNISLVGTINGDVRGVGERVQFNGTIEGNVKLHKGTEFSFGPEAKITGNLSYGATEEKNIPDGIVGGKVMFEKTGKEDSAEKMAGLVAGFSIYSLLSTLFFGLLLIWFLRHGVVHNAMRAEENILKSMGIGFLFLVATPVAAIIFMITVIGIPVGLFIMAIWVLILCLAKIFAGLFIGKWIIKVNHTSSFLRVFGSFSLGTLIFVILGLIPIFGWVIRFLILLIALGGFLMAQRDRFSELRKKKLA